MTAGTISKYKKLGVKINSLLKEREGLRQELAEECKHPAEFVSELTKCNTDGFGRLYSMRYGLCCICYAENHYGTWVKKENLNRHKDD